MIALRLLETLHGHLGILAVAALLHPAILLRKGAPLHFRSRLSVGLSTAFTVAAFCAGIAIYGDYRERIKPELWAEHRSVALLFETKEHLAYGVLAFTIAGCGCALFGEAREARVAGAGLFAAASLCAFVVAAIGTYVAAHAGF